MLTFQVTTLARLNLYENAGAIPTNLEEGLCFAFHMMCILSPSYSMMPNITI